MPKVIVFGSMNMDLSIEASHMPAAGETVEGWEFITNPGGKGANQAVAAARLGAEVRMVGAVGTDAFGDELVEGLRASDVNCGRVRRSSEVATGVAVIVRSGGDNRIVVSAGANHLLGGPSVSYDLRELGNPGDVFLAQGECDHDATIEALHVAHELGLYTIFNPAPAWAVPEGAWDDVDLVCVNETECEALCGVLPTSTETCQLAAGRLRAMGAGAAVITLGAAGSAGMGADGELVSVAASEVEVVDTTGAGDTYIGALAVGRVRDLPLIKAMALGSVAAGIAATRLGAQQSIPTIAEVGALR